MELEFEARRKQAIVLLSSILQCFFPHTALQLRGSHESSNPEANFTSDLRYEEEFAGFVQLRNAAGELNRRRSEFVGGEAAGVWISG
nr:hypothetical protein Iba_chr02eCG11700 [Ipomoea batatas]GMC67085.1 hypothetical protein Iba_chr02eCG11710 [Ipomoea batatas]GMD81095.1 hypothetical protein Iba_chr13eCG8260 [Ipomoea batatas]